MTDKVLSMIGLATRARKIAAGEFSVEKAVKSGRAFLVIVAEDASDNTKKMFKNMCAHYEVPLSIYGAKETLGHATGKEVRASLAILDQSFADAIQKLVNQQPA